ncbi:MAG: hypothetical protein A2901_01700 [Elusimicrobia bacterium RIFCSPLOWO2_01_FULL_54_10]|nr:MAG: hypothetical protein A2901_01700 [Elusimicrobia bacterium RIFCSPLOWO2_01_FULL_54_10]
MITLEWLRENIRKETYQLSSHASEECDNENILLEDIEEAILGGEILESYADRQDIRGESCLILGRGRGRRQIHIVAARSNKGELRIVTAYLPRPPKWVDERVRG